MALRFSVRNLMLAIVVVAIGCTAVAYPSRSWSSGLFSAMLLLVTLVALGAAASRGAARAGYGGFAWLGGVYLVCAFGPWFDQHVAPQLPTARLIYVWDDHLKETMKPTNAAAVSMTIQESSDGATIWTVTQADGSFFHVQVARPGRQVLARIVHSLSAFVLAMLGALAGRWFYEAANHRDREWRKSSEMP